MLDPQENDGLKNIVTTQVLMDPDPFIHENEGYADGKGKIAAPHYDRLRILTVAKQTRHEPPLIKATILMIVPLNLASSGLELAELCIARRPFCY